MRWALLNKSKVAKAIHFRWPVGGLRHPGIIRSMTQDLFRNDAYLTECSATVTAITPQGIVLDRSVFYPLDKEALSHDTPCGAGLWQMSCGR